MKDNTWEEIAIVLETTPDDCKRLWKNLRGRFTKEKRTRSGEAAPEWQYFNQMLFYDKHCTPRRTITATPCGSSGLRRTNEGSDNESSQPSGSYRSWTSTSPELGTSQGTKKSRSFLDRNLCTVRKCLHHSKW
jgi:hypothetical protein